MNDKLEQLLAMSIYKSLKLIHSKGTKEVYSGSRWVYRQLFATNPVFLNHW